MCACAAPVKASVEENKELSTIMESSVLEQSIVQFDEVPEAPVQVQAVMHAPVMMQTIIEKEEEPAGVVVRTKNSPDVDPLDPKTVHSFTS